MSSICLKQSNSIINLYLSHFFGRMLYSIVVLWLQLKNVEKYTFCAPCFIRLAISLLFYFIHSFPFGTQWIRVQWLFLCCSCGFWLLKDVDQVGNGCFFSFTRVVHFSFLRFLAEKKVTYISWKNHRRKQTRWNRRLWSVSSDLISIYAQCITNR